ncbi:MAG TPA: PTS sugar transporter subunit IIA [Pyrinomonadaceae bacterium]|nr:PTS sugar transporter subunit IIA [Pyrinomonadaceae bacterium]HLE62927.1 PTS sugar transporter subunit IIA [Pyrinomonadaceae bacterium]
MSNGQSQGGGASDEGRRIAGVIVTHGHLAGELLAAAEMIIGPVSHITAVSIGWHDDVDVAREEVQRAIVRVSQKAGVLLLTDMFGGTPTNIASMFLEEGRIEVLTGVNLPMVIKLATQSGSESLAETARRICDQGRQGIYLAGDLLTPPPRSSAN